MDRQGHRIIKGAKMQQRWVGGGQRDREKEREIDDRERQTLLERERYRDRLKRQR